VKTTAKKSTAKKILKWAAISVSSLIAGFIIFALVIAFFYQEKVKNFIVNELNKNLRTEISVEKIELSLLKKFPYATLSFYNLTAKDAIEREKKDTLLFAENLFLNFNIIDIFKENYKIKAIDIKNARLNLKIYKDYSDNYTFWKESTDTTDTPFKLELKKISCDNVHVKYLHLPYKQLYDFNIQRGIISGKFDDEVFNANMEADLFVNKIQIDDLRFLNQKKTNISLDIEVNNKTSAYNISDGELCVGGMCFTIAGLVNEVNSKTNLDISVQGKDIELPVFIEELPEQYKSKLINYESSGKIHFKALFKGLFEDEFVPNITIEFGTENGVLKQKQENIVLNDISFKAIFRNGEKHNTTTSKLVFENFNANMPQGSVHGNFSIENFDNPILKAEAKARLNLNELFDFLNIKTFDKISGNLNLNFLFNTQVKDFSKFKPEDFINSKCQGNAQLVNTSITLKENKKSFRNINGAFQFNNNDIVIDSLNVFTELSDFKLNGYFRNALSYIFIPGQKISVDAGLRSNKMAMDELLFSSVEKNDTVYKLKFSDNIDYNMNIDIKNLTFGKFEAQLINGKFTLKNKILKAENISFNAFDGAISASATIDGRQDNLFLSQCKANLKNTDINKMFYQLENFGQKELVDKNIKGRLTTEIDFIAPFDAALNINLKSLYAFADITIENGELIEYETIKDLSKFINVNDLAHIKFETLKNRIEIKDKTIHFPGMSIKSNAINIEARGTHTFDNKIDYHLRILLSELLGKKAKQAKKENEEFGIVEEDGLGRITLFIKITGTVDNPVISYDSKSVFEKNKNDIKQDFQQTIRKIGEELFKKNDTINSLKNEKEKLKKKKKKDDEILEDFKIE